MIQPLLDQFSADTGIEVKVRYGSTSGTVNLLLEEGTASPADVVLLQDAGALGALAKEDALITLPDDLLNRVDKRFRSWAGEWVGVSGRARTVIYNTTAIDPNRDLPASIHGFAEPEWRGRLGWAPANGSLQAFVTALRVIEGDAAAKTWLEGIKANKAVEYPKNTAIVDAVGRGEVEVGFVNHYYLYRFLKEKGASFGARNHYLPGGAGALINVAGVGISRTSDSQESSKRFVKYLLSEPAQRYFAEQTMEYPLTKGVDPAGDLPSLVSLNPPDIDLSNLDDLRGTLALLRKVGVLP
ncbi:iron ABC transporter substrate-binding protein [Dehalococcoidia bacterium]|nr:iron ABC transporter substrate-binding protein [Dehalococcoidia bacterium]